MKILMLNYEFPPIGGGASPVTFELCVQLVRMGHRVDVVTMHYDKLPRFEVREGINIYRTPAIRKRADVCQTHEMASYLPGALIKAVRLAKREKFDVIHCHFMVPGGPVAWMSSKLTGLPFLITCHGSDVPGHNPERFTVVHKLIKPVWRFLARRTPLIISPSESLKKLILHNCPGAKVEIIPNGIHTLQFKPSEKTKSILMCSRFFSFKGFQYAIRAIKDTSLDWQVNLVGEGPYLEELKKLAEGFKTPIKFWGWLDKSDPKFYELFAKSSIFVFPSEAENFPSVLLEAMAAGTAIITSNAGGCPEVVGEAGLLVPPRDIEAIRSALNKLIGSEQLRNQLSQAAVKRVKMFDWENVAGKYVDCYRRLTEGAAK
jgi:glycosyltransferase involved in cell wall biosynthesis